MMFQGAFSGVSTTTYPVDDADILSAEDGYTSMETELMEKITNYEAEHDYDEYRYNLAEIEHDPYVLISAVTALMGGEWTVDEIGGVLTQLFEAQYIFTETVITETRYRDESRIGYYVYTDPNTGGQQIIPYEYTVRVPCSYTICTVTITNVGLEAAAESLMTEDKQVMYELYMSTLGNRPDLFE